MSYLLSWLFYLEMYFSREIPAIPGQVAPDLLSDT